MMRKEKSRGIFCGFYIKWFITGFEYPWHSYMTYIRRYIKTSAFVELRTCNV